jgi:hypothetical protein
VHIGPAGAAKALGSAALALLMLVFVFVIFKKRNKIKKALISTRVKSLLKVAIGFYTIVGRPPSSNHSAEQHAHKPGANALALIASINPHTCYPTGTMEFTFGVPWPVEFSGFLRTMQLLTLDLSSFSGSCSYFILPYCVLLFYFLNFRRFIICVWTGFFCKFSGFSYYDGLLAATFISFGIFSGLYLRWWQVTRNMERAMTQEKKDKAEQKCHKFRKASFYFGVY